MQDPQHTDENAAVATVAERREEPVATDRGDESTVDGTDEPTDADPLLPEVAQ